MNRRFLLTAVLLGPTLAFGQQKGTKYRNLSPAEAAKAIKANPNLIIIDIRTPQEFANGHIPNAVNIDFKSSDFKKRIEKLDREKSYLVHCRSGGRSEQSLPIFKKLGFKQLVHLKTGILGWQQVGLALTTK